MSSAATKSSILLAALWASSSCCSAFSPSSPLTSTATTIRSNSNPRTPTSLNLDGPDPGTKLVSNRKEIAFDGSRFFETGVEDEDCIPKEEYCLVDPNSGAPIRLSVEEKERMFLDALQSYYVSGRQVMDDAEFDALKEDLAWSGSEVVNLNRKEIMYLEAMQAYIRGEPILSDAEFDQLRDELRGEGSSIAVDTEPKCYIETGVCTVTFQQDKFRNNLLYLPMISIIGFLWLGIGYEILGGKVNPLVLAAFGSPVIGAAAKTITDNLIFPKNYVAYGPCPTCEAENRIYFGDILGVEGFDKQGSIKCKNCKSDIIVMKRSLRASTLPK
jgi:DNA-directed RNA polymerase subunit RPC12/RpoP